MLSLLRDDRMPIQGRSFGLVRWSPSRLSTTIPAVIVLAVLTLSSCAARTSNFKDFSQAGMAYAHTVAVVLNEAGETAIDADSMVLLKTRPHLSPDERGETIIEHNALLLERLELLRDLKRHARLLGSYFEALAALSNGGETSGVATAAEGVVSALGNLHPKIANAEIAGRPISSFVGPVAGIVVAGFKSRALEEEVKKRAPTIEQELELQRAALAAVAEQMRTDLLAQFQQQESRDVVLPYAKDAPLPANWAGRRKEMLKARVSLASVDSAAHAARRLKLAFVAIAEGRSDGFDVSTLLSEIRELRALIEHTQSKAEETN